MTTLDRYIIRTFITSVILWFIVLMSVRVMADLLFNFDEFADTGGDFGERIQWIATYYSCQSVLYFAELGGVIIVAAAVFSLARMNYTNELTAILASGVSLYRVLFPILIGSVIVGGLIFIDREFLIPSISHRLVRTRDNDTIKDFMIPARSDENRTAWYAKMFNPAQGKMVSPRVVLRTADLQPSVTVMAAAGRRPTKSEAERLESDQGWILEGAVARHVGQGSPKVWPNSPTVAQVFTSQSRDKLLEMINQHVNLAVDNDNGVALHGSSRLIVSEPKNGMYDDVIIEKPRFDLWVYERVGDTTSHRYVGTILADRADWHDQAKPGDIEAHWELTNGVLFVPTDLDSRAFVLRQSSSWLDFLALKDVTKLLTFDQAVGAKEAELTMHARMTEPIYNVLLLLLGVPFILPRERNLKTSAGLCMLAVCKHLDMVPSLRAWLPLMVFGPIAALTVDGIKT
ncbi:MAG: LptF/LptG family permease [Planctomycetota bacterium]|nr:LptF/LptG family permease [Planctomycetota bacterium]